MESDQPVGRLQHKYGFLGDQRLSWKARGIMMFIVDNFSGRDINMEVVYAGSLQDGCASVRSGIKELVGHGYLKLKPLPSGQGWVWGRRYFIAYDEMLSQDQLPSYDRPQTKPRPGFVYVIQCGESFKIGCTANLKQRIKALGVNAPHAIDVHVVIPTDNMIETEWHLHQRFKQKRQRGEWFSLNEEDIETIRCAYDITDPSRLIVT